MTSDQAFRIGKIAYTGALLVAVVYATLRIRRFPGPIARAATAASIALGIFLVDAVVDAHRAFDLVLSTLAFIAFAYAFRQLATLPPGELDTKETRSSKRAEYATWVAAGMSAAAAIYFTLSAR